VYCPVCRSEYAEDWKVCPKDAASLLTSQYVGKYRMDQLLGAGGMGAVYRAYNPDTASSVAIKLLHGGTGANDAARARFQREASSVAALSTRHVVSIYDFGADRDGTLYLVMEYLNGHSLRAEIAPIPNAMPLPRVNFVIDQTLRGLAAAHKVGIVHRDLKPENLFVADTDDGEVVKVLDFGIARMQRADTPNLTSSGALMGTPAYMAPEQVAGNRGMVDRHSDVYAMGVIIYELATGTSPFHAETLSEVLSKILTRTYTPLAQLRPDLPPGILQLVESALSDDPAQRFGSAVELREAWVKAWSQLPPELRDAPVPALPKPEKSGKHRAPDFGLATDVPSAPTQLPRAAVAAAAATPSSRDRSAPTADIREGSGASASFDDRRSVTPGPVVVDAASTTHVRRSNPMLWVVGGVVVAGAIAAVVVLRGGGDDAEPRAAVAPDAGAAITKLQTPIDAGAIAITPDATVTPPPVATPPGMVRIAGQTLDVGTPAGLAKNNPNAAAIKSVTLAPFFLDEAEFAGPDGQPLVGLSWDDALGKCAALGKRLPTADEWELAARDGTLDPRKAALKTKTRAQPAPIKTHPDDRTRAGVYDLLGNVSEWTATDWPKKRGHKIVRGSGVAFAPTAGFLASIHARFSQPADKGDPVVGFRCAQDIDEGT